MPGLPHSTGRPESRIIPQSICYLSYLHLSHSQLFRAGMGIEDCKSHILLSVTILSLQYKLVKQIQKHDPITCACVCTCMHPCMCMFIFLVRAEGGSCVKSGSANGATSHLSNCHQSTGEQKTPEASKKLWALKEKPCIWKAPKWWAPWQSRCEGEMATGGLLQRQELPSPQQECHPDPQVKSNSETHVRFCVPGIFNKPPYSFVEGPLLWGPTVLWSAKEQSEGHHIHGCWAPPAAVEFLQGWRLPSG